ncbi:MAG: hypothetical protein R3B13_11490 [Polyangiaceae bacterium]
MPTYEYEILGPDGAVQGIYEVEQRMSDAALTEHPQTGAPLRRVLSRTFAHGSSSGSDVGDFGCASGACDVPSGACGMGGGFCGSGGCA